MDLPPGADPQLQLLTEQLAAFDELHATLHRLEHALGPGPTREQRRDLKREHEAALRTAKALQHRLRLAADAPWWEPAGPPRALIAHSHPWYAGKLAQELEHRGVSVLATVSKGADALGIALAEAPELHVVDLGLEMLTGTEVARALRQALPHALLVGCVTYGDDCPALLEAGCSAVYSRHVAPEVVADEAVRAMLHGPDDTEGGHLVAV